jgi:hypothetical protein
MEADSCYDFINLDFFDNKPWIFNLGEVKALLSPISLRFANITNVLAPKTWRNPRADTCCLYGMKEKKHSMSCF